MPQKVIETAKLTKIFGKSPAVADLDLSVVAGEVFGFLGPNGSGKSTTIRMLLDLAHPTSGDASVFGLDTKHDYVKIHKCTGYLPGDLVLFPRMTGLAIIHRFAKLRGVPSSNADEFIQRFDATVDRPVRDLSKGNRQKLGLVLAFMHRPELLILDEPTSGLDPLMQDAFENLVREIVDDGKTVFLSSHDLSEVQRVADRVAIIRNGALVISDTVENLRSQAPRTIEMRFDHSIDVNIFRSIEAIKPITLEERHVVVELNGSIAPLLHIAADLEPSELTTQLADLDQLFRRYYQNETALEDSDAH